MIISVFVSFCFCLFFPINFVRTTSFKFKKSLKIPKGGNQNL